MPPPVGTPLSIIPAHSVITLFPDWGDGKVYFLYFLSSLPLNLPPAWSLPRVPACPSFALPRHSFPHPSRSLLTYLLTLNLLLPLASICLSAHTRLRTNAPSEFPAGFLHVPRFSSYWRRGWCRTIVCDMGALITTEGGDSRTDAHEREI